MTEKIYGRIGTAETLEKKIYEAKRQCQLLNLGCIVERDEEAGTVSVSTGNNVFFRALAKNADTWLIMYNEDFYPKD